MLFNAPPLIHLMFTSTRQSCLLQVSTTLSEDLSSAQQGGQAGYSGKLMPWKQLNQRSVQFSSVVQSCPDSLRPHDRSTPGLPVHHQLPEFTQTHVHWVGEAIQPSHPLSSPSPPAFNLWWVLGTCKNRFHVILPWNSSLFSPRHIGQFCVSVTCRQHGL